MRTIYREKKYPCGEYLDVYIFPTYKTARSRSKKSKPSTAVQKKLNQRHAQEKLIRLSHANFAPEDLSVGLDYAVNPEDDDRAKKDIHNYLDRVKRRRKKLGLPSLKYIVVTEKSSRGRYHHHVIMNGGIERDELERIWGLGHANTKRLQFDENGIAGLGHYIVKSPVFAKSWNASRNLIDPLPKERDGRISQREARDLAKDTTDRVPFEKLYPDYLLADASAFHNDFNGGVYLFARLYRKDGTFIKPRRKNTTRKESAHEKENGLSCGQHF